MDHGSFDRIARLLGAASSRRAALGALLGAGALGAAEAVAAKKHRKQRKHGAKGKGGVSAQLVCPPPANGVNRNNCDYSGQDFSGQAIHSSSYKNTIFRNAELVETDLSSSNMRAANFRGANLCGADLSSSTLTNADFRGFPPLGRPTNLAFADLHSSGCGGLQTNARTFICGTTWCDGTIRNDSCPGGPPPGFCCSGADCPGGQACVDGTCDPCSVCGANQCCADEACVAGGTWGQCGADGEACARGRVRHALRADREGAQAVVGAAAEAEVLVVGAIGVEAAGVGETRRVSLVTDFTGRDVLSLPIRWCAAGMLTQAQ